MEIIIGKNSGFCNGVRYTVEQANKSLNDNTNIYCLGEIVHNERVISELENKGMKTIDNIEDVPNNSKVIIRAHGEKKSTYEKAKENNIEIIDLTCGKIKSIRKQISEKAIDNFIIIIGKKEHPETLGVLSFVEPNAIIIENEEDIPNYLEKLQEASLKKVYIVSQTTFNSDKFDSLVHKIKDVTPAEVEINKTICNATSNRQEETRTLSKEVDAMIIIGGKHSSNTKELEVVSKENCNNVFLVQDYKELEEIDFSGIDKVGIMAGASTPQNVVNEIVEYLNKQ